MDSTKQTSDKITKQSVEAGRKEQKIIHEDDPVAHSHSLGLSTRDDVVPMFVGKSAIDNWKILSEASQIDTIFHLTDLPSPYVILKKPFDELTKADVVRASIACKSKSKSKSVSKVSVLWTPVSNVYKGTVTGEFIISSNSKVKHIVL